MHQQLLEVFEIFVSLLRILIMNKIYNGEEFYERAMNEGQPENIFKHTGEIVR